MAADMPQATELTVGIMAVIAQQERQAISKRTKEALAATKARGQVLGNPNGAAALRRAQKGNRDAVAACKAIADTRADQLGEILRQMQESGKHMLGAIAAALNEKGVLTSRAGRWHRSSVANLLKRLDRANA